VTGRAGFACHPTTVTIRTSQKRGTAMTDLVRLENGKATVSSKKVADTFGKVHRNVLRDIANLECSKEFRVLNFEQSSYTSAQGKVLPCVEMTRDGFCFLAMGFTGDKAAQWKESFLNAFNSMEAELLEISRSVMGALDSLVAAAESDKARVSIHGKALAHWKKVRKQHIKAIADTHAKVQLVLGFES